MNIEKSVFFMWAIWYFYTYGPPPFVYYFFTQAYFILDDAFIKLDKIMHPNYFEVSSDSNSETSDTESVKNEEPEPKQEPKYEDKYLDIIRKLNKDWQFTEDEINEKNKLESDFLNGAIENIKNRIEEIATLCIEFDNEIKNDSNVINYIENFNEDGDELVEETTLEERNEYRKAQINELLVESNNLKQQIETEEGLNNLKSDAEKQANNYIINKRIDNLKNCYVMEKTPQGNVLMIYNKRENHLNIFLIQLFHIDI